MLKSFIWTAIFWSLFTATNSITDSILFHQGSPWYDNSDLWHFLKYWWIGFAVLTGCFAIRLWMRIKYIITRKIRISNALSEAYSYKVTEYMKKEKYRLKATLIFGFLLAWFIALRYFLFEGLMDKWKTL